MNYPLISEYIEAIKSAEDNLEELSYLRSVLGDDGLPVMTSGNFAVVFKMKDEQSGKFYAVKCFTKEQEGRAEAYREITKELKDISSPYLVSFRYLEKELFVDTDQTAETDFPVLLMDWVEGKTLDKYLRENLDDKYALEMLTYRFSQLAQWLIPQPFAHGDLKPDNILVREDGTLVLVDYDGMYVPAMKGQKARELGSPDFRHPLRTENDFDGHIDDFSLASILLSLKSISMAPQLFDKYGVVDGLLFSKNDYQSIDKCEVIKLLFPSVDKDFNRICSTFIFILSDNKMGKLPTHFYSCHISTACLIHYFELGEKFKRGVEVEQNGVLSVQYYKIAAELGYKKAQYKLGVCYSDGYGVNVDYDEALRWLNKAADQGDLEALYNIGNIYRKMNIIEADSIYNDAVKRAKRILDSQEYDSETMCVLGICLLKGKGTPKDANKAFVYLKKAAEGGNSNAQAYLGYCYHFGEGVVADEDEAIKWYEQSSNQGNPMGKAILGLCYMRAYGVVENKVLGLSLLNNAAKQGHSGSQETLGCCYLHGEGVVQDYNMAFSMFDKSAQRGYTKGMYNLAFCYENGLGTIANRDKARYWYEKAARKGNNNAQKALERFTTEGLPF